MKQLLKKVKQISMLLLVISILGCENDDDNNYPEVIAGFTYTINVDTGTVTFINTSVNSRNYFWTFGDGTSSTEINPIKTFSRGEYLVTLKATNVAGASNTFESIIVISDVGAPIITLLGDTTMNIMIGGTFTDPGATATDDVDGDLTTSIVVGGNAVNVNTAGTYIITYNVSDAAGNTATQRTRTVIVAADVEAPVITLNGNATINVLVGGTFTDPGATAMDNVDGNITANIVVAGDAVNVNTAGTYIITYNVSDAAGNAATQKTRTVIVAEVASTCPDTLLALPINFDCDGVNYESKRIAGGIDFSIVDNPQLNGANATASKVGKIVNKGDNWENLNFKLDTPINFTTNKSIKLKLYSTVSAPIKLKLETGGTPVENDQTHGGTGWEVLTFTLGTSESFSNIIVFIDGPGNTAGTFYIDDIEQVGGGGVVVPPSDCPAPPAGELLSNGGFEAGNVCWQFFAGTSVSSTVFKDGSKSAEIQGSTGAAVGIKMERFAAGILLPNTSYTVSFDIIASGAFGEGGVFKVFTFSEGTEGGSVPATQHILADGVTSLATSWEKKTYTFKTAANANQVEGGLSFYMEIVNSSVKLNVDNVVIKKTP